MTEDVRPLLDVARELGTFTKSSLSEASGAGYYRVKQWIGSREAAGEIIRVGVGPQARVNCQLSQPEQAGVPLPARVETPLGNMWTAMRGLVSFTALDLTAHACTDTVRVTEAEAAAYCRALLKAGYLRAVHKAVPGRRPALYRLIRNSGPRPPRERRITGVWDDNLGRFTFLPEGEP